MTWVQLRVQPHKEAEVLSAVDHLLVQMRGTQGCDRSRLLADSADPHAFSIVSEWASAADVDTFLASTDFQIFKGIRILLRGQPVVVVDDVRHRVIRLISP